MGTMRTRRGKGDWFGGARKGISSASKYEKILEKILHFTMLTSASARIITGAARKTEFLQWLPFVKDDRARGIQMLIIVPTGPNITGLPR